MWMWETFLLMFLMSHVEKKSRWYRKFGVEVKPQRMYDSEILSWSRFGHHLVTELFLEAMKTIKIGPL